MPPEDEEPPGGGSKNLKALAKSAAFCNYTSEQVGDRKKDRKQRLTDVIKRLQKFEELPPEVAESFGITPMRHIVSQACEEEKAVTTKKKAEMEKVEKEKAELVNGKGKSKKKLNPLADDKRVSFTAQRSLRSQDLSMEINSDQSSDEEDDKATYFTDVFGDYLRKNKSVGKSGKKLMSGAIAEESDCEEDFQALNCKNAEQTRQRGDEKDGEDGTANNPLSAIMNLTKKLQERSGKDELDEEALAAQEEARQRYVYKL